MSARAAVTLLSVVNSVAASVNISVATLAGSSATQDQFVRLVQRAYQRAYNLRAWEDAWSGASYTPVARVVAFSAISDSRRFEVWDSDPRDPANGAQKCRFSTSSAGLLLTTDETSVFILSMPVCPSFASTAFAGWGGVNLLAVLEEFTIAYARGTYWLENGQPQTGAAERSDALVQLDELARTEYCRTAYRPWKPTA